MTVAPATCATVAVLVVIGLAPALCAVGIRWVTLPLAVVAGAVITGQAATELLLLGGALLSWIIIDAAVVAVGVGLYLWRVPARRPTWPRWRRASPDGPPGLFLAGCVGAVGVGLATVWALWGVRTHAVGFDARAIWILRGGWFLDPHPELLFNMRTAVIPLYQSGYPPLVSAVDALAWRLSGTRTETLGPAVTAVVTASALVIAALAPLEWARTAVELRWQRGQAAWRAGLPLVAGVAVAISVVVITAGVAGPFLTNGYADPVWSVAAVGALAYGLQASARPGCRATAWLLVVMAGTTKDEAVITASLLVVLFVLRGVAAQEPEERRRAWWRPVISGVAALAIIGAWPLALRIERARGRSTVVVANHLWPRVVQSAHGLAPYLHSLLWALVVSVIGVALTRPARRAAGLAGDGWAWAGVAAGLLTLAFVYGTASSALGPWLISTVHRVSEFTSLAGWWIVAAGAVVAATLALDGGTLDGGARPAVTSPDASPDDARREVVA